MSTFLPQSASTQVNTSSDCPLRQFYHKGKKKKKINGNFNVAPTAAELMQLNLDI